MANVRYQEARDRRLTMLVSDEEHAMLVALARDRGLALADVVRMYIRDAYIAKFGDTPASTTTTKPKTRKPKAA